MGNDKLFQKRKKKAEIELQRREGKGLTTTTILIVGEGVNMHELIDFVQQKIGLLS